MHRSGLSVCLPCCHFDTPCSFSALHSAHFTHCGPSPAHFIVHFFDRTLPASRPLYYFPTADIFLALSLVHSYEVLLTTRCARSVITGRVHGEMSFGDGFDSARLERLSYLHPIQTFTRMYALPIDTLCYTIIFAFPNMSLRRKSNSINRASAVHVN